MSNPNIQPAVLKPDEGRKIVVLGQEITVKLTGSETGGEFYLFENIVPPGARVPPHVHQREDEILQILEGELEVTLDGRTTRAPAGSIAYFPRNIAHGFGNTGTVPAKGRFLVSPASNFEKFFAELSALPAHQPPDMRKVAEIFERYGLPFVPEAAS
ncbi:MAG: cupin domain-containing protein [Phycisphaerales bacterium]